MSFTQIKHAEASWRSTLYWLTSDHIFSRLECNLNHNPSLFSWIFSVHWVVFLTCSSGSCSVMEQCTETLLYSETEKKGLKKRERTGMCTEKNFTVRPKGFLLLLLYIKSRWWWWWNQSRLVKTGGVFFIQLNLLNTVTSCRSLCRLSSASSVYLRSNFISIQSHNQSMENVHNRPWHTRGEVRAEQIPYLNIDWGGSVVQRSLILLFCLHFFSFLFCSIVTKWLL